MRILMEQSGYALLNMGDWAMLRVAVQRCRQLFPGCHIDLIGDDPARLRQCIPEAEPITVASRDMALGDGNLFGRYAAVARHFDQTVVRQAPGLGLSLVRFGHRLRRHKLDELDKFIEAVRSADLVLATGGGYITDSFPKMVANICDVVRVAQKFGKLTAMVGQGLGPLTEPWLIKRARQAMKGLGLISLREGLNSPGVAAMLGAPRDRIVVTGDDAIELAYALRPSSLGTALGLNLRATWYSGIQLSEVSELSQAIGALLKSFKAEPQIVPISFYDNEDIMSTQALLGGESQSGIVEFKAPEDVARAAGRCRVVITGSYHAGVFALSQGIPVIGVAKSAYYVNKFQGLASQFGPGCAYVRLDEAGYGATLQTVAQRLWDSAEQLRTPLLERAEEQIMKSRAAYESLAKRVACAA